MSSMRIRRLGWAGVELEAPGGETAVVDLLRIRLRCSRCAARTNPNLDALPFRDDARR
jgi:hypothetical protein